MCQYTYVGKALAEGNQWYFYSRKTQNRMTGNGYWKPMGIEESVLTRADKKVGLKKYYIFHLGEAPAGVKTNWIMQEYRLSDSAAASSSNTSSSRSSKRRVNSKTVSVYIFLCFFILYENKQECKDSQFQLKSH